MCVNRKVTGFDFDGGYAEYMIAPAAVLAAIPDELPAEEAGPFMCAGVTVYNALRNSGAKCAARRARGGSSVQEMESAAATVAAVRLAMKSCLRGLAWPRATVVPA